MTRSYAMRCVIAGCAWGVLAYWLGHRALRDLVFAGVVVSPLIGLLVGRVAVGLRNASTRGRFLGAGAGLYGASVVFGLVVGVAAVWTRKPSHVVEVLFEPVLTVLWGITVTAYVVVLWPLAYFTLLWILADPRGS